MPDYSTLATAAREAVTLAAAWIVEHHADEAFFMAAKFGVRQHHWRFGDMPAQPQVPKEDVANIARYIRELQVANGIVYREHRM